jgi:hypothetical protein
MPAFLALAADFDCYSNKPRDFPGACAISPAGTRRPDYEMFHQSNRAWLLRHIPVAHRDL